MENPWSSPWTTDDDPPKESASAPAAPSLAFPPAVKFDIADPSSLWAQDDGFGVWGGGSGRASPADMEVSDGKHAEDTGDNGFLSPGGPDAADVDPLPSPSVEGDPWAAVVSPVAAEAPEKLAFSEESVPEQKATDDTVVAEELDAATRTPHASPKPLSPVNTGDRAVDETTGSTRELVSPDASPGRGADAVALTVLKHRDDPSPGPESTRQVSKVQELVDMYDGIAKKASDRPPEPGPSAKPRRPRPAETDEPGEDAEDWEEFEFGDQKPYDDITSTEPTPAVSTLPSPKPPSEPAKSHINEASLSTLFDHPTETPPLPADITDRLDPLDSFTISERRAWYRLSRQGSPRLHDIGDPDNYARVTWQGSAISTETFAIVRRWMQEDAVLGGRSRVGGVRGSAATFGWEHSSSSDPVDLSFLKKRRSTEGRQRSESTAASFPKPAVAGLANGAGANARPLSVPTPPKGFNLAPEAPTLRSQPVKPSPLVFASTQETASRESDSDEEWGEMVTSPEVTSTFRTEEAPRADSAVSFGKSASGSSLDSRPAGPKTPTVSKPEVHEVANVKSAHARVTLLSTSGPAAVRVDTSSGQASTPAKKGDDVQIRPGEIEMINGVISHLPDLSYMMR